MIQGQIIDAVFGPWFDLYVRYMVDFWYFPYTLVPEKDQ